MFYLYNSVNYCTGNQCFNRRTKGSNEIGLYQCSFCFWISVSCSTLLLFSCYLRLLGTILSFTVFEMHEAQFSQLHMSSFYTHILITSSYHQRASSTHQTQSDKDESRQDLRANSRLLRQESSRRQQQTKNCTTT